jgi:hypothetical protein
VIVTDGAEVESRLTREPRPKLSSGKEKGSESEKRIKLGDPAGGNNEENRFSLFVIACAMR